MSISPDTLIPAKAGTQAELVALLGIRTGKAAWVPAFAGMSGDKGAEGER